MCTSLDFVGIMGHPGITYSLWWSHCQRSLSLNSLDKKIPGCLRHPGDINGITSQPPAYACDIQILYTVFGSHTEFIQNLFYICTYCFVFL